MVRGKPSKLACLVAILAMAMGFASRNPARAMNPQGLGGRSAQTESPSLPAGGVPADAQLVNANTFPTIRIPVSHSTLNWTLIKPRIRASFGWLEIDRDAVRYNLVRQSRVTKEADQGFELNRTALLDLKMEYGAAEFRAGGLRHFFTYSPQSHWDAVDANTASARNINQADGVYTPYVVRASKVLTALWRTSNCGSRRPHPRLRRCSRNRRRPRPSLSLRQRHPSSWSRSPRGASENQTIEVNEATLTVRGVAMDDAGLPTINHQRHSGGATAQERQGRRILVRSDQP